MIRSADRWTDHKLICAKIAMKMPDKLPASKIRPRFSVSSLKDCRVRERYNNAVFREVSQDWNEEASGGRQWRTIKEGMSKAAEAILGQERIENDS